MCPSRCLTWKTSKKSLLGCLEGKGEGRPAQNGASNGYSSRAEPGESLGEIRVRKHPQMPEQRREGGVCLCASS